MRPGTIWCAGAWLQAPLVTFIPALKAWLTADRVLTEKPTMSRKESVLVVGVVLLNVVFAWRLTVSRETGSWREARDGCLQFGGRLATLKDLDHFRSIMETNMTSVAMANGKELWVGGNLVDKGWVWTGGEDDVTFQSAMKDLIVDRGCFVQQFLTGGATLPENNAEKCFSQCQWKGAIGLKKHFCICERDLRNVTAADPAMCHFTCDGSHDLKCGGLLAVSIYQTTGRTLSWAEGEPRPSNDCAYIRRKDIDSELELVSSTCDLQTRYLCRFRNDDKCGSRPACIRWTTRHATWPQARRSCESMNGHLAAVDATSIADLRMLPPGIFWIALKRQRFWKWADGSEVPVSDFHAHERQLNHNKNCAVIHHINGRYGFSARSCLLRRNYLCHYDYMQEPVKKRSDLQADTTTHTSFAPVSFGNSYNQSTQSMQTETTTVPRQYNGTDIDVTYDISNGIAKDPVPEAEPSTLFGESGVLSTCIYLAIGFLAGVAFVLLMGFLLFLCLRCSRGQASNKKCGQSRSGGQARYSADRDSVQLTTGSGAEGLYDTVDDLQTESPFRRTQRLIRMGSATSWRHGNARRPRSDIADSPTTDRHAPSRSSQSGACDSTDFTWRGMVGGKIEVLNTQLRRESQENAENFDDISYVVHDEARHRHSHQGNQGGAPKFPDAARRSSPEYQVPEYVFPTAETFGPGAVAQRQLQYSSRVHEEDRPYPTFVEMEAKLAELEEEENLYASIKKTLKKSDMQENTRKKSESR